MTKVHRQHDIFGDRKRRKQLKKLKYDTDVTPSPNGYAWSPLLTSISSRK